MIRLILFFVLLGLIAWGGVYLVDHPGHIELTWFGYQVQTSAALLVIAIAVFAIVAWAILRFIFGLPSFVAFAARRRRREKGYDALSRGLVAVNAGDARTADRASAQATRQLRDDPLALMLRAQSAQLSGDSHSAIRAYQELAQREDTRLLGLRGLHAEASRRGDDEAAHQFAQAAHKAQSLPWTAKAKLEHASTTGNWEEALRTVEAGVSSRQLDKETSERQRAVLETAIGYDKEMEYPDEALSLARAAMKRAPDLAPPVVLATRLLSRRGDIRKASKLAEKAWPKCPHPDIADAYLDVRPGDSTTDRLARARTLMNINAYDPVSRMTVARAALANTDYDAAREAMEPLVGEGKRPTVKMCLLMAELEEAEHGHHGLWREWLSRASRAALDPAWIADGTVYEDWAPASPTTGRLDAFRWQVPAERLGPVMDALPQRPEPVLPSAPRASLPPASHRELPPAQQPSQPSAEHAGSPARELVDEPVEAPVVDEAPSTVPVTPAEADRAPSPPPAAAPPSLYDRSAASHDGAEVRAENAPARAATILATPSVPAHDVIAAPPPEPPPAAEDEPRRDERVYTSG